MPMRAKWALKIYVTGIQKTWRWDRRPFGNNCEPQIWPPWVIVELVFIYCESYSPQPWQAWAGNWRGFGGRFLLYSFPCLKSILLGLVHWAIPFDNITLQPVSNTPLWFSLQLEPFLLIPSLHTSALFSSFSFWLYHTFSCSWHISPFWTFCIALHFGSFFSHHPFYHLPKPLANTSFNLAWPLRSCVLSLTWQEALLLVHPKVMKDVVKKQTESTGPGVRHPWLMSQLCH